MEKAGPGQAQSAPRIGSEPVINELAHRVGWGVFHPSTNMELSSEDGDEMTGSQKDG